MISKTAMITICGRPNVGKSTLTNALAGEKIAIVSNKPQTTRNRITAVCQRGETQFVFLDTPGFHKPRTRLGDYMVNVVRQSVADVDAVVLVVEPVASLGPQERELIASIKAANCPAVLAINKLDTVEPEKLLAVIALYSEAYAFNAIVPISAKTGDDAVAEFVNGQAVFYQNGTWAYNDVAELGDDNLGMLPIYIGVDGEENQGLCTGSENFWCVNNASSDADIQATLDFLYWCVTSEAGTSAMADKMGFVIPFKKAKDSTNPLIAIANDYVAAGKTSVDWCFSTMPSEEWKNGVGSALTAYAAGTGSWDDVVTAFVDGWAKEYKLANG